MDGCRHGLFQDAAAAGVPAACGYGDEITSQQLIAAGVVRVNENRVDVDLAQQ